MKKCVYTTSQMYRKPVLRLNMCFCLLDCSCCLKLSVSTLFGNISWKYIFLASATSPSSPEIVLGNRHLKLCFFCPNSEHEHEQSCDSRRVVQACGWCSWEDCYKCHQNQVYLCICICICICVILTVELQEESSKLGWIQFKVTE